MLVIIRFLQRQKMNAASLALLFAIIGMVFYASETLAAAKDSLSLCIDVVIPSLFPFFVLSTLAVDFGLSAYAGTAFERVMRFLFNVPGACAPAFVLGIIGGYPVGAKTAIETYKNNLCTKTEAERLLAFCNNSGPAFILGTVGSGILGSGRAGMLLLSAHILASVTVGIVFSFYKRSDISKDASHIRAVFNAKRISESFVSAVRKGFLSMLGICGFIIFFAVVIRLLFLFGIIQKAAFILSYILSPFGFTFENAERILTGFIEITSGLWSLSSSVEAINSRLALASFILGWAGVSVHCQVLSFMGDCRLSIAPYIIGKLFHAFLSSAYTLILIRIFPIFDTVSASLIDRISNVASLSFSSALLMSLFSCISIWILFVAPAFFMRLKKNWKKVKK